MSRAPVDGVRLPERGGGSWLAARSGGHRLHAGLDLHAGAGTVVRAPEAGRIVLTFSASTGDETPRQSRPVGWAGYGPYGLLIHGDSGWYHLLGHVDSLTAIDGARVAEGDVVAVGSPVGHVHWEVRARSRPPVGVATVETCADPRTWLDGAPVLWSGQCPPEPDDTVHTPRACRPGWRGPAPLPFARPLRAVATPRRLDVPRNPEEEDEHG